LALLLLLFTLVPSASAAGEEISTQAAGAIVIDFQTRDVYFEKDADTPRPAASMSKIMSVYLVLQAIHNGQLSYNTPIPISAYAAGISNNRLYSGLEQFQAGESPTANTLLQMVLTASCNASMIALGEYVAGSEAKFTALMNRQAELWGVDAHFADCTGFLDAGNAVSPRAMADITCRALTDCPEILAYASLRSTEYNGKTYYSTNSLLRNGTVEGIDGLKTGFTYGAGYCFTGTALRDGVRIVSVVMNTPSASTRMSESQKLLEYGFACREKLASTPSQPERPSESQPPVSPTESQPPVQPPDVNQSALLTMFPSWALSLTPHVLSPAACLWGFAKAADNTANCLEVVHTP